MRIARLYDGKKETFGLVREGRVATRESIMYKMGIPLPVGIRDFMFDGWLEKVRENLDELEYADALSSFELLAPIPRPPKIMCLAFNYPEHARTQDTVPSMDPVVVMKPRTALCGSGAKIVCPPFVKKLDYEIELAIVMGRDCKNIDQRQAAEAIFGYMILNDVSARDIQFRDKQFTRAKSFDTFAPCGPWITTADEILDPASLSLKTHINGKLRQDSSTSKMHIKPFDVVSRLSQSMSLERGDIISTGTPYGSVLNTPDLGYLKGGDQIEMEIEGLNFLRNVVVEKS